MSNMGFDPSALIMTAIVLAFGAMLLLTVFSKRLPERLRRTLERMLGVGYPLVVGLSFVALAWNAYTEQQTTSVVGFIGGGVLMVLLAARSARRGLWKR